MAKYRIERVHNHTNFKETIFESDSIEEILEQYKLENSSVRKIEDMDVYVWNDETRTNCSGNLEEVKKWLKNN